MKFWTNLFQLGTLMVTFLTLIYINLFLGQYLSPIIRVFLTIWGVAYLIVFTPELKAIKRVTIRVLAQMISIK